MSIKVDIVVFDDDPRFHSFFKSAIDKFKSEFDGMIGRCTYYDDDRKTLHHAEAYNNRPSIFIIDIMLGNLQAGYEIAVKINKINENNVIFYVTDRIEAVLTDNMEHKMQALGFILKTSGKFYEELRDGLIRAYNIIAGDYFIWATHKELIKLRHEDIYYIQKEKGRQYACIYHKKGKTRIKGALKHVKDELHECFCYSTKDYLVNTRMISKLSSYDNMIYFKGGELSCPFSRTRKNEIIKFMKYLK